MKLLSMTETVKLLGVKGQDPSRKLRKLLREIGEKRKVTTLIERNKRFYTTMAILKRVMPDEFVESFEERSGQDSLQEFLRELQGLINKYTHKVI